MLENDLHLRELKEFFFAIMELVKNTFIIKLGAYPGLKELIIAIPAWAYLFIILFIVSFLYVTLKFIGVRAYRYAMNTLHGSSLGNTIGESETAIGGQETGPAEAARARGGFILEPS